MVEISYNSVLYTPHEYTAVFDGGYCTKSRCNLAAAINFMNLFIKEGRSGAWIVRTDGAPLTAAEVAAIEAFTLACRVMEK